jgi:isopentenyl diphosphate isomerase/L-lactate dehydrogenase-like FMN-dependent dehydrogenase
MLTSSATTLAPLDRIPAEIRCAGDYEMLARRFMAASSYEYVAGGSAQDVTLAANLAAFADWSVYPRLLNGVTAGHLGFFLAGLPFSHPVLLAPVAYQKLAHPLGELETARAAHAVQSCLIASTLSSCTLEDVARVAGPQRWFQLYFQPSRDATRDLLARAEAAGYQAIVLTLDAQVQVPSARALQAQFRMPADCTPANLRNYAPAPQIEPGPGQSRIFQGAMRGAPTWRDLEWLMKQTALPIWIKGVAHPADACAMRDAGAAGIVVSNHGGRGLDGAPASLSVLPGVRAALGPAFPVLFDGGIRSGSDIFKALALGANAVSVGRLQMYALSVAGALGVAHMVRLLLEELEICMALAGCATVAQIDSATLYRNRTI